MQFDLYYIVKHGEYDGHGIYEAGPFKTWDAAWEARKQLNESWQYDVFAQTIEVE